MSRRAPTTVTPALTTLDGTPRRVTRRAPRVPSGGRGRPRTEPVARRLETSRWWEPSRTPLQPRPRSTPTIRSLPLHAPTTRASMSREPSRRATCTFVRSGKRAFVSRSGPTRGSSAGSPSTTACGFPTSTGVNDTPATCSRARTTTGPRSCSTKPPPRRCAVTSRAPDLHCDPSRACPLRQPARSDPGAVARHLRARPVRVPDRDLDPVVATPEYLEDPVGVTHVRRDVATRERRAFSDEVDVPLRLPARRSHLRAPPVDGSHRA